jgi:AcrR family transcriptional regulator/predicted DNA-binding transcriptional regulator AlpA
MSERPKKMKMAELVRISGTARSTIHHYANLGLLPRPELRGPKLHLFGSEHVAALQQIKRLRERGVSLQAIRPLLERTIDRQPARSVLEPVPGAILAHAAKLFVRDGYDGMHMGQLAADLNIAKATLYRHFSSKHELFLECVEAMRFTLIPRTQRAKSEQQADPRAHGRDRARAILEHFAAYRGLTSLLQTLTQHRDARLATRARSAMHEMITNAEPFLRRRRLRGEIRNIDSELLAYMLWGALLSAGDRLAMDAHYSLEQVLAVYLDFVERGMLTNSG